MSIILFTPVCIRSWSAHPVQSRTSCLQLSRGLLFLWSCLQLRRPSIFPRCFLRIYLRLFSSCMLKSKTFSYDMVCKLKLLLLSSSPIFLKAQPTSLDVLASELCPSPARLGLKTPQSSLYVPRASSREEWLLLLRKLLKDLLRLSVDLTEVFLKSLKPIKPAGDKPRNMLRNKLKLKKQHSPHCDIIWINVKGTKTPKTYQTRTIILRGSKTPEDRQTVLTELCPQKVNSPIFNCEIVPLKSWVQ